MDFNHIRQVLSSTTARMQGQNVAELMTRIASNSRDLKSISLDDQLLMGAILGSYLHQSYCDDRRLEKPLSNGLINNPRIKELNQPLDQMFVKDVLLGKIPTSDTLYVEDGKVFMDIANTNFASLSPYWQYDNFMAGASAARSVITNWDGITHPNPEVRKHIVVAVANAIHESWIGRGNVEEWNKDLETAYINLSADEQYKDLKHYKMATQMVTMLCKEMGIKMAAEPDDVTPVG